MSSHSGHLASLKGLEGFYLNYFLVHTDPIFSYLIIILQFAVAKDYLAWAKEHLEAAREHLTAARRPYFFIFWLEKDSILYIFLLKRRGEVLRRNGLSIQPELIQQLII